MPIVKMPNGDQVSFPDSMPKSEIQALILKKFPNVGSDKKTDPYETALSDYQAAQAANLAANPLDLPLPEGAAGGAERKASDQKLKALLQARDTRVDQEHGEMDIGQRVGTFAENVVSGVPVVGPLVQKGVDFVASETVGRAQGYDPELTRKVLQENREIRASRAPVEAVAGQLTGAIAATRQVAKTAPGRQALGIEGPNALTRYGAGVATNALVGGADAVARGANPQQAAGSAALAGGLTAALPVVGKVAGMAKNALIDPVVSPFSNALKSSIPALQKKNALSIVSRRLANDNVQPSQITDSFDDAMRSGDDSMMLLDAAGKQTKRLARAVSNIGGEGAENLGKALDERQLAQQERVTQSIRAGLNDPELFFGTVDDILAKRASEAAPLYAKAYGSPISMSQNLENILKKPSAAKALSKAITMAADEGVPSQNFFASIADDGTVSIKRTPGIRELDYLKRGLDDVIGAETDTLINGVEKVSNKGRIISNLKRELLDEMDAASPEYAAARKVYSSQSDALKAIQQGGKLLKADPEIVRREIAKMSPSEKELAQIGVAKELTDKLSKTQDRLNAVTKIFGTPRQKKVLQAIFDDDAAYNKFVADMTREAQKTASKAAVQGNSTTAQQLGDISSNALDAGVMSNLASGRPVAAAGNLIQKALSKATVFNEQSAKDIADILMTGTGNPKAAQQLLSQLESMAIKDANVAKNLAAVRKIIGTAGAQQIARQPYQ